MTTFGDLFTDRQLVALNTFSDLVHEARAEIERDALAAGLSGDPTPLRDGGTGAKAYAEAVSVYLAFALNRSADTRFINMYLGFISKDGGVEEHLWSPSSSHDLGLC